MHYYQWQRVHSNNGAVAKLLVDGGADVNVRDDSGVAPLAVAVACGHSDVLKVLLDHPDIDVDTQVYMYVCVTLCHLRFLLWTY